MSKERSIHRLLSKERGVMPLGFRMDESGKYLEEDPEGMKRLKKVYKLIKRDPKKIIKRCERHGCNKVATKQML